MNLSFKVEYQRFLSLLLVVFSFFIPLGFVKVFGVSITFFIFLVVFYLLLSGRNKLIVKIEWIHILATVLFIIIFLSVIFSPISFQIDGYLSNVKLLIQYFYWLLLFFIISGLNTIHRKEPVISGLSYGLIAFVISYFTFWQESIPQNVYAFTVVALFPVCFYYFNGKGRTLFSIILGLIIVASVVKSGSRAGSILVALELLCIILFLNRKLLYLFLFLIFTYFIFSIHIQSSYSKQPTEYIGEFVRPYNSDLSDLLIDTGDVNENNKSWLIRKLMLRKGIDIFKEYPWLGIGASSFNAYQVELKFENERLGHSESSYNTKTAHNTYIQVLAENGSFGLIVFILMLITMALKNLIYCIRYNDHFSLCMLVTIGAVSIYFWVISAITGALTWLVFGLATLSTRKN